MTGYLSRLSRRKSVTLALPVAIAEAMLAKTRPPAAIMMKRPKAIGEPQSQDMRIPLYPPP